MDRSNVSSDEEGCASVSGLRSDAGSNDFLSVDGEDSSVVSRATLSCEERSSPREDASHGAIFKAATSVRAKLGPGISAGHPDRVDCSNVSSEEEGCLSVSGLGSDAEPHDFLSVDGEDNDESLGPTGSSQGSLSPDSATGNRRKVRSRAAPAVGGHWRETTRWPIPSWFHTQSLDLALRQATNVAGRYRGRGVLIQVGEECHSKHYGTPRRFFCSHCTAPRLTLRNRTELPSQLFFDVRATHPANFRCASPDFVEWLMGFPRGWTAAAALPREALLTHPVFQLQAELRASGSRLRKVLSLFSGCGGLDFGTSPWFQVVAYCEKDPDACDVLDSRMSDGSLARATILRDAQLVKLSDVPDGIEGIVLGSPCTDFSIAKGPKRKGIFGEESSLIMELFRLCDLITNVCFVFFENVDGICALPSSWEKLLGEFLRRGFVMQWVTLCATAVGSPQRRRRFFLLARRGRSLQEPVATLPGKQSISLVSPQFECFASQCGPSFNPPGLAAALEHCLLPIEEYARVSARLLMLGSAVVPLQGALALCFLSALPAPP